ncbi:ABC transporter substrate-binding protein [Nocardioides caldifontis]|uniref:ABC transporter substrate-binding protein n=1 Tax=Nocardioides caldifontis TaxID=2588938 RepID=UPI0011DF0B23|nr:ABC transporter substrate-binding protein [Nocardioides caldifontis]
MKRLMLLPSLAAATALALVGCGDDSDPLESGGDGGSGDTGTIVVGSANFPENVLLAEIYAGALNAAGVEAETRPNIGSRETYIPALEDGSIQMIPEYTGNLRLYFDENVKATEPQEVYDELLEVLPEGLEVTEYSEAEDKDAVVVTSETAEEYDLTTIADLAPVAGELKLGGPPEWKTRFTGVPGLKEVYGVEFADFVELDAGGPQTLGALRDGRVDAGNLFTTDPALAEGDLVTLEDPESLFAAQNIVPLLSSDVATDEVTSTVDEVSAALDTELLGELLARVVTDKEDPADVAADFLAEAGLD